MVLWQHTVIYSMDAANTKTQFIDNADKAANAMGSNMMDVEWFMLMYKSMNSIASITSAFSSAAGHA